MAASNGRSRKARPPRSHTYNLRLVRQDYSYLIQEIAELFRLHRNAVRRWVKAGLKTIDRQRPHLVHGTDLVVFLDQRQRGRKRRCRPGEMYCCRCRAPRRPGGEVAIEMLNARQLMVRATCELCGAGMNRCGVVEQLPKLAADFAITTAQGRLNETAEAGVECHFEQGVDHGRLQS